MSDKMINSTTTSGYQDYDDRQYEEDNIDIKRYISLFISNWYWFAAALFISITLAYGINRYSEKVYNISSTLLIKDDQNTGLSNAASNIIPGGDIFKSQQNLTNELAIIKSFSLNYMVMKELIDFHVVYISVGTREIAKTKIYKTSPFVVIYDSLDSQSKDYIVSIKILSEQKFIIEINSGLNYSETLNFGQRFSKFGFNFIIEKRNQDKSVYNEKSSNKYYFYFTDPATLANQYRSKLVAYPFEKESSIINLSVSGYVAEQEADYLNKLMEVYIEYGLNFKKQIADSTMTFINQQLNYIADSLEIAAKKLENFRRENNFINLTDDGLIIQNRMEKYESEKASIELQVQYYNYLLEYLSNKNDYGTIISPTAIGLTDQVLIGLVNELSAAQREKEKLEFNIGVNQPVQELYNKQINIIKEALKENIRNGLIALNGSKNEIEIKIGQTEKEINGLPSLEKSLIKYQRQFDLNNTVYTYLLEKRAEAGIASASTMPDNRIIDYAQYRDVGPIKPKTKSNYLIALIIGLMVPIILLVLIDYFNNKVIDKKDIERKTQVPVIGYISHNDSLNEIPVAEKPGSLLAESFRSVRTAIKYFVKENETAIIAVSSTISSEGKTFISINLASIFALVGKKVLLIGLDLRKPRINNVFGFDDSCSGMSTFLSGNCELNEIIKETTINNLYYIPSGPIPPNPAELIETEQMKVFIGKVRSDFDYIIFDTPPIAVVTDAILLSQFVDINLFIVRQRFTTRNTLDLIQQMYIQGKLKNMAIIMNDISLMGYYGYGMRYGNMYGYGFMYGNTYYGSSYYGRSYRTRKVKAYYKDNENK